MRPVQFARCLMSSAVSRTTWVNLYKQLRKEANKLAQYNHREFAARRIRDHYEANKGVSDPAKQQILLKEAQESLALIKRQVVLGQLYPHRKTFVEEAEEAAHPRKECSKCKSNEYTNKALVMLVNECAHPLCRNCVDNLYARNAAPCHVCGRMLRKTGFWEQVFDDPMIEKENFVRKRLRKIFNLHEDDFPTLQDFNDYLENFENLVWCLVNEVNVEETEREIAEFKAANGEMIERNRKRLDSDQQWVADQLRDERDQKKRLHDAQAAEAAAATEKLAAQRDTKAIMDELRESKLPAELILDRERKRQIEAELEEKEEAERRKKRIKEQQASRKRAADQATPFGGPAKRLIHIEAWKYVYAPPALPINGPDMPAMEVLEDLGYMQYMRAAKNSMLAGGYVATLGAARALLEARLDLFSF